MVLLESDAFLTELSKLYADTRASGSVFVTMKQHNVDGASALLVRASTSHAKISTLVAPRDHRRFQEQYSTIVRASMDALAKKSKEAKKRRGAGGGAGGAGGAPSPTRA
mmetsp:Transcript_19046/g.53596  ORF Transcript_19046/g.53596 Transcript_19046/m.53596 type:complete len:109 (-) Transcript_19046:187-513(-)